MKGMVAAVTGASAGFGEEIARSLAGMGARLVLIGRREERLQRLAADLGAADVQTLACDIRDTESYVTALRALPEPFAAVDVLINNAGVAIGRELAQDSDLADWLAMVETNVTGLIVGTQALLPGMVARRRGHIVNIGSVAGEFPTPGNAIYAASKAFVRQFSLCLRADLLGTGVRVTDVEPGQGGGTEFGVVRARGDAEEATRRYAGIRWLTPRDVAEAVAWAVSRPDHVNVNIVQFTSIDQAFGPPAFVQG